MRCYRPELLKGLTVLVTTELLLPDPIEHAQYTSIDIRKIKQNPVPFEGQEISSAATVSAVIINASFSMAEVVEGVILVFSWNRIRAFGISSNLIKSIICCSSGTPGQYINETYSGIVVCPGDYTALAEVVMYLKENPDVAEEMGQNGREIVMRNLTTERAGVMMKSLFPNTPSSSQGILLEAKHGVFYDVG